MKRVVLGVLLLVFFLTHFNSYSQSTIWKIDPERSIIKFTTSGPFGKVGGNLSGLHAQISFDENHPDSASFYATIDVATIKTGLEMRDDHLKENSDMLYTNKYPLFIFKSTKVRKGTLGYTASGDLTIKNVTRQVDFPFTFEKTLNGVIFKGGFSIDAYDYSVGAESKIVKIEIEVPVKQ